MFTTNLAQFKTQQEELHRRAAHYHLVKSIQASRSLSSWLINLVASLTGNAEQRIGSPAQAAR
jgi:hypothetical protein